MQQAIDDARARDEAIKEQLFAIDKESSRIGDQLGRLVSHAESEQRTRANSYKQLFEGYKLILEELRALRGK